MHKISYSFHKRQAEEYDKRAWGSPFKVGEKVWLSNPSTPRTLSSKLVSHWTRPYAVKNCLNEVDYVIQNGCHKTLTLTLTVHHNRLKPCTFPKSNERLNTPNSPIEPKQNKLPQPAANHQANEPLIGIIPNMDSETRRGRPARNRHPPNRYGNAIIDYDNLMP